MDKFNRLRFSLNYSSRILYFYRFSYIDVFTFLYIFRFVLFDTSFII